MKEVNSKIFQIKQMTYLVSTNCLFLTLLKSSDFKTSYQKYICYAYDKKLSFAALDLKA